MGPDVFVNLEPPAMEFDDLVALCLADKVIRVVLIGADAPLVFSHIE